MRALQQKAKDDKWPLVLVIITTFLFVFLFITFYPGFMSGDTYNQFLQAKGIAGFEDWHPPLMAIIWRALIRTTSFVASLLAFQLLIFCVALILLAWYIYNKTGSKLLSLLPFVFGLSPHVINLVGVLWKDSLLGVLFLLLTVLALYFYAGRENLRNNKYLLLLIIILIIGIANLRHNVWPALMPFVVFLILSFSQKLKIRIILLGAILAGLVLSSPAINWVFHVKSRHVEAAVMVDDIQNLLSTDEINNSSLQPATKQYLIALQNKCRENGIKTDSLFLCANPDNFVKLTIDDYPATKELWSKALKRHFLHYVRYRVKAFILFLSPESLYAWQEGIDPNAYGLHILNTPATAATEHYVKYFMRDWPSLFKPYLWLLMGLILLIYTLWRRPMLPHTPFIVTLIMTGVLYTLIYIPSVIVSDYRMTYLLSIAVGLSYILLYVDLYTIRHQRTKSRTQQKITRTT